MLNGASYSPISRAVRGFPSGSVVKNPPTNAGDIRERVQSLGQEHPLEKGMATHSNILA